MIHPTPERRDVLKWTAALAGAAAAAPAMVRTAAAQPAGAPTPAFGGRLIGYVLSHEQFPTEQLVQQAEQATAAGFEMLATSDHFQPWQSREGNAGLAWITLGAAGSRTGTAWMGTHVTCPTTRYHPAIVAEAFATLDRLYPGRIFLGVGSGEALNEQSATGQWPKWSERWERLAEAIAVIRALWTGQDVHHLGKYYTVDAKLYSPPKSQIPLLTAANGPKAMALAGTHGDGLITDGKTWKNHKPKWEQAARAAGRDPGKMPVMMEAFVVVGGSSAAKPAAELWRFLPKAWDPYVNVPNPVEIQRRADAEVPISDVLETWIVGPDPQTHIKGLQKLFDSGVTHINVHSAQPDQAAVIDFYGKNVLPHFRS